MSSFDTSRKQWKIQELIANGEAEIRSSSLENAAEDLVSYSLRVLHQTNIIFGRSSYLQLRKTFPSNMISASLYLFPCSNETFQNIV